MSSPEIHLIYRGVKYTWYVFFLMTISNTRRSSQQHRMASRNDCMVSALVLVSSLVPTPTTVWFSKNVFPGWRYPRLSCSIYVLYTSCSQGSSWWFPCLTKKELRLGFGALHESPGGNTPRGHDILNGAAVSWRQGESTKKPTPPMAITGDMKSLKPSQLECPWSRPIVLPNPSRSEYLIEITSPREETVALGKMFIRGREGRVSGNTWVWYCFHNVHEMRNRGWKY